MSVSLIHVKTEATAITDQGIMSVHVRQGGREKIANWVIYL